MDLPWKRHFGITCSCGKACAFEVTREQTALPNPTEILRSLSPDDQQACARFYAEHQALGHDPQPDLIDLAPLPES